MGKTNRIMFKNLRAEMARKEITITEMATKLGITRETLGYKLSGKRMINLDEALLIVKEFFPECDVYYLFVELVESQQTA